MPGMPLPAINRRSRASAEPRYREGSLPKALYPARVANIAEDSSGARGSGSFAIFSSHERSASCSPGGVVPVATAASTQPSATLPHLAFNSVLIPISIIHAAHFPFWSAPQLLKTLDVCDQPIDFRCLQALSVRGHLVFSFFDHRFQLGVAFGRRLGKVRHTHAFPRWRVALPARSVANRAFRFVERSTLVGFRRHVQPESQQYRSQNSAR